MQLIIERRNDRNSALGEGFENSILFPTYIEPQIVYPRLSDA